MHSNKTSLPIEPTAGECCCTRNRLVAGDVKCKGRKVGVLASVLSAVAFVMVPKCPACLVPYLVALTGLGISVSVASYVRTGMILTLGIVILLGVTVFLRSFHR